MSPTWFVERREALRLSGGSSAAELEVARYRGASRSRYKPDGVEYSWRSLGGGDQAAWLPAELADDARLAGRPWDPEPSVAGQLDEVARQVRSISVPGRLRYSVRSFDQLVTVHDGTGTRRDRRRYATVGVEMSLPTPTVPIVVRREGAYPSVTELVADLPSLLHRMSRAAATAADAGLAATPEPGAYPVVLAPGMCALFFHEICGHPMEGDVLSSGTSYLCGRAGDLVADSMLTVHDDPVTDGSPCGYRVDDEGTSAVPVALIDHGRVGEPLTDIAAGAALGLAPNGHGRRMNYMFPAVPRQAHTRVAPYRGGLPDHLADIEYGVFAVRLRMRQVDIATGQFSFYVSEGRVISDGELGEMLSPQCVIRGNALDALRLIDAVGADEESFLGGGGCGKLDQGPLVVSFAQPTIRFSSLHVDVEGT